jgi:hypothetical protein
MLQMLCTELSIFKETVNGDSSLWSGKQNDFRVKHTDVTLNLLWSAIKVHEL